MEKKLTGIFRQKRNGLTIYRPKDERTVTRIDFNRSFEEVGKFDFDAKEDGGSQGFLRRMLKQGFHDCIVVQKGNDNEVDGRRKRVPARELGKSSSSND